jgi:Holliday junction resolvasome RuvABC endonuclease subunit
MIALDYSLSCPAMALSSPNLQFYYLTSTKKNEGSFYDGMFNGKLHSEWTTPEDRYEYISDYFINILDQKFIDPKEAVYIEDYSFGSKGRTFHIAENTGLIKYKLWKRGHDITVVPPTVIKKYATGKGNAKKPDMHAAFQMTIGKNLCVLGKPDASPVSDIVDAYWILRYGMKMEEAK